MNLRTTAALSLAAATLAAGAATALAAGPPPSLAPSLTPNGKVIWNLDALLNDANGARVDCFDDHKVAIFSVAHGAECPSPLARYQTYVFTFLNASGSQFHLVSLSQPPATGASDVPLQVDSRYVSCPDPAYPGPGWIVAGGGAGPNGEFWCE